MNRRRSGGRKSKLVELMSRRRAKSGVLSGEMEERRRVMRVGREG